jgi:uncharacterized protein with PQ loop repeat
MSRNDEIGILIRIWAFTACFLFLFSGILNFIGYVAISIILFALPLPFIDKNDDN